MAHGAPPKKPVEEKQIIEILLVDDNVELRDTVKKMLQYEKDLRVVGEAGTGREGVKKARELQPHIILMDINMPDMKGLEATGLIKKAMPYVGVIMMSAASSRDYILDAMRAGADDFIAKPPDLDKTIRTIHEVYEKVKLVPVSSGPMPDPDDNSKKDRPGDREGNIIVVYSPQGGCGKTTIATSLASGLLRENTRVLLVDTDLQFADVAQFVGLQSQQNAATIVDLAEEDIEALDMDYIEENIIIAHESGLRVLLGPIKIDNSYAFADDPAKVAQLIDEIAPHYDFVIVDTSSAFTLVVEELFFIATKILLVTTPTVAILRHQRFLLDYLELGEDFNIDKLMVVVNHVQDERNVQGKPVTVAANKIAGFLKVPVVGEIPYVDPRPLVRSINHGIPIIASDKNQNKTPIKQLVEMCNEVYNLLVGEKDEEQDTPKSAQEKGKRKSGGIFRR